MRTVTIIAALLGLAGCNQADTTGQPQQAPSAKLQPRVNLGPVAPAKAKAVMHERHEGMERIGKLTKQLGRDTKADPMDLAAIKPAAAEMNALAQKAGAWFPRGTGPELGKTGAKPDIWQKPQDFAAKMTAFQNAAAAFNRAAQSGNAAATGTAFGELGKSCKACHQSYRKEMH